MTTSAEALPLKKKKKEKTYRKAKLY